MAGTATVLAFPVFPAGAVLLVLRNLILLNAKTAHGAALASRGWLLLLLLASGPRLLTGLRGALVLVLRLSSCGLIGR